MNRAHFCRSTTWTTLLAAVILIGACSPSTAVTPDAGAQADSVETAVAATMVFEHAVASAAAATQINSQPTPTPTPEFTPTTTPSPTPNQVTIHATVDTNCRQGPDPVYPVIGYLTVGQTSTVQGRLRGGGWWYIENTTAGRDPCWVWGQTTATEGDPSSLPYITPPPTPTPLPSWTGNWMTSIVGIGDYSFYLQQSGDYLSAAFSSVVLFATLSDYDQRADGVLYPAATPANPMTPTPTPDYNFAWRLLPNGDQFRGYVDHSGTHFAWCGARNGMGLPDPCLGP
jgi:hypothetical protein